MLFRKRKHSRNLHFFGFSKKHLNVKFHSKFHRINHQVSSSKLLMRKLTIKLTSLKCDTNRPYLNLKLDGERIRPHDRIRIFRTIEKLNLKYEKLHLHKYILGTNDELEKRINSFENLKTLVIENCIFRSPQNQRVVTSQVNFIIIFYDLFSQKFL